jgi:hypothetical protein
MKIKKRRKKVSIQKRKGNDSQILVINETGMNDRIQVIIKIKLIKIFYKSVLLI